MNRPPPAPRTPSLLTYIHTYIFTLSSALQPNLSKLLLAGAHLWTGVNLPGPITPTAASAPEPAWLILYLTPGEDAARARPGDKGSDGGGWKKKSVRREREASDHRLEACREREREREGRLGALRGIRELPLAFNPSITL